MAEPIRDESWEVRVVEASALGVHPHRPDPEGAHGPLNFSPQRHGEHRERNKKFQAKNIIGTRMNTDTHGSVLKKGEKRKDGSIAEQILFPKG